MILQSNKNEDLIEQIKTIKKLIRIDEKKLKECITLEDKAIIIKRLDDNERKLKQLKRK